MDPTETLNKLKNIDQEAIDNAMGIAEKLFGAQMTAKAKESIQSAEDIQSLLGKLSAEDFSAIEKALSGKKTGNDELENKLKEMLGG